MTDIVSTHKKRRHPRYICHARISIYTGLTCLVKTAVLKDLSILGCSVTFGEHEGGFFKKIERHEIYVLHVSPENQQIEKFKLLVRCRWIRCKDGSHEIGFSILSSPSVYRQYKYHCRRKKVSVI